MEELERLFKMTASKLCMAYVILLPYILHIAMTADISGKMFTIVCLNRMLVKCCSLLEQHFDWFLN